MCLVDSIVPFRPHRLRGDDSLLCSWGVSRQEYWSGLPRPPAGGLLNPGITPRSPTLQADSLPFEPPGKPKTYPSPKVKGFPCFS